MSTASSSSEYLSDSEIRKIVNEFPTNADRNPGHSRKASALWTAKEKGLIKSSQYDSSNLLIHFKIEPESLVFPRLRICIFEGKQEQELKEFTKEIAVLCHMDPKTELQFKLINLGKGVDEKAGYTQWDAIEPLLEAERDSNLPIVIGVTSKTQG